MELVEATVNLGHSILSQNDEDTLTENYNILPKEAIKKIKKRFNLSLDYKLGVSVNNVNLLITESWHVTITNNNQNSMIRILRDIMYDVSKGRTETLARIDFANITPFCDGMPSKTFLPNLKTISLIVGIVAGAVAAIYYVIQLVNSGT